MKPSLYKMLSIEQDANQVQIKQAAQTQINKVKLAVQKKHYRFLGLKDDATIGQLKKAAQLRIQKIKKAYSILSNPNLRREYDKKLVPIQEVIIKTKGIEFICPSCGHKGKGKYKFGESPLSVIALWILFFIPGMILIFLGFIFWLLLLFFLITYTIRTLTSIQKICSQCHNQQIIPLGSPRGKELFTKFYAKEYAVKNGISPPLNITVIQEENIIENILLGLSWFFSIFFLFFGITGLLMGINNGGFDLVIGITFSGIGLLILPSAKKLFDKLKISLKWKIALIIILLTISSIQISYFGTAIEELSTQCDHLKQGSWDRFYCRKRLKQSFSDACHSKAEMPRYLRSANCSLVKTFSTRD